MSAGTPHNEGCYRGSGGCLCGLDAPQSAETPQEDVALVRKAHADAMMALAADVHPYSATAIWDNEAVMEAALDRLEQRLARLEEALRRIVVAVEAWDNDETPGEDFPFEADMDFMNFCGHVARAALAAAEQQTVRAAEESLAKLDAKGEIEMAAREGAA